MKIKCKLILKQDYTYYFVLKKDTNLLNYMYMSLSQL